MGTLAVLAILAPIVTMSPWLLSAGLILGCGVYVAYEFSLVKISERQLERDIEEGVQGAQAVLRMKRDMNAMLAACQFGITVTSLGLTLALEPAIHHALARFAWAQGFSVGLAMFTGAFLHVTFGELVPKGLALVIPKRILYTTAPFMQLFRFLAIPFIKTCNTIANAVVKAITGKNPDTDTHDEEGMEIGEALLYAHASGQIKPEQLRLMRNVLSFADRTAREVATHARDVVTLDLQDPWEANLALMAEHGYSRYPVIDSDLDNVVGYVRRADVLEAELKGRRELKSIILPIERRPETVSLRQVNLFQGSPMIALYDEYDSFSGLLTSEDVVEQIVGEIYDETDEVEAPAVQRLSEGVYRLDGSVLLEEAALALDFEELEEHQDVDTIGGLVMKLLGRQPRAGDQVALNGYRATVEDAQGFRIRKVKLERYEALIQAADQDVHASGHTGV